MRRHITVGRALTQLATCLPRETVTHREQDCGLASIPQLDLGPDVAEAEGQCEHHLGVFQKLLSDLHLLPPPGHAMQGLTDPQFLRQAIGYSYLHPPTSRVAYLDSLMPANVLAVILAMR